MNLCNYIKVRFTIACVQTKMGLFFFANLQLTQRLIHVHELI